MPEFQSALIAKLFWTLLPILLLAGLLRVLFEILRSRGLRSLLVRAPGESSMELSSSRSLKGWLAEKLVAFFLWRSLDQATYRVFNDVIVPVSGRTAQIDHVVVSRFGVFVVETKAITGWIFGGEKDENWTQKLFRHSYSFQNPVRQNYWHTRSLSEYLAMPHEVFFPVVFFVSSGCEFKTPIPANVLRHSGLIAWIKAHQTEVLSPSEELQVNQRLRELKDNPALNGAAHVASLKRHFGEEDGPLAPSGRTRNLAADLAVAGASLFVVVVVAVQLWPRQFLRAAPQRMLLPAATPSVPTLAVSPPIAPPAPIPTSTPVSTPPLVIPESERERPKVRAARATVDGEDVRSAAPSPGPRR